MIGPFSPIQDQINAYFPPETHPYRQLESVIDRHLTPKTRVLEVGCGRNAPLLQGLRGRAAALYGIDVVEFEPGLSGPEIRLINTSATDLSAFENGSIDLVYSRSVMEHISDAHGALSEIRRVLAPSGRYIFLTPNRYDYVSMIASIVPNRHHSKVVEITEGRPKADTFPTFYRANSFSSIRRLGRESGFEIESLERLNQYPSYLRFNRPLFWLGCQYERALRRFRFLDGLKGWILCVLRKSEADN